MKLDSNFQRAKKAHRNVAMSAQRDEQAARDLWAALGGDDVAAGYAEAVRDTMSDEHALLVASCDVARAYAFDVHDGAGFGATALALRDCARARWERFDEKAKQTGELARGFGWDLSLAWKTLADVNVGSYNLAQVSRVAKLAGRMYAALRGAATRRVLGIPEEVHSIEMGRCVPRLLPSELAQLADDDLELGALARLVEGRALQYAVRGSSPTSKGPLVLCLDESSSMHDRRRTWSKAAAIALMRVAFDERRPVVAIHYSTSIAVRPIAPGDAKAVLGLIGSFLGGGTAIGRALDEAGRQVTLLAKRGGGGADVVLVSDGEDGDADGQSAAIDTLDRIGARLWTVAIECSLSESAPLRKRAVGYTRVDDLDGPGSVLAIGKAA